MFTTEKNAVIQKSTQKGIPCLVVGSVDEFDVSKTFDCGQCFRFEPVENSPYKSEFAGVAYGRFISVARDKEDLLIFNCTKDFFEEKLCHFLSLDMDYRKIRQNLAESTDSSYLRAAAESAKGIRILNQDRWETLCSFIISQNNNIPRIKKLISALSASCGEKISTLSMKEHGGIGDFYSFPSPQAVLELGENALKEMKFGFRASYIYDAAKKVAEGEIDLDLAATLDYPDCVEYLSRIKGVGVKVASCTALFSMEKYSAFPVDVWIKRVLERHFPAGFDPATLGKYAGIAQQYLFYHARFEGNIQ